MLSSFWLIFSSLSYWDNKHHTIYRQAQACFTELLSPLPEETRSLFVPVSSGRRLMSPHPLSSSGALPRDHPSSGSLSSLGDMHQLFWQSVPWDNGFISEWYKPILNITVSQTGPETCRGPSVPPSPEFLTSSTRSSIYVFNPSIPLAEMTIPLILVLWSDLSSTYSYSQIHTWVLLTPFIHCLWFYLLMKHHHQDLF